MKKKDLRYFRNIMRSFESILYYEYEFPNIFSKCRTSNICFLYEQKALIVPISKAKRKKVFANNKKKQTREKAEIWQRFLLQ